MLVPVVADTCRWKVRLWPVCRRLELGLEARTIYTAGRVEHPALGGFSGIAKMQRVTISLDEDLAQAFDELMRKRGYASRSEAMRDLLCRELGEDELSSGAAGQCVAVLSYLYDHHERQLSSRLTRLQHDHHDLVISTMHAHISHNDCIETAFLRGETAAVMGFAQTVIAETGVRHGRVEMIPFEKQAPRNRQ